MLYKSKLAFQALLLSAVRLKQDNVVTGVCGMLVQKVGLFLLAHFLYCFDRVKNNNENNIVLGQMDHIGLALAYKNRILFNLTQFSSMTVAGWLFFNIKLLPLI